MKNLIDIKLPDEVETKIQAGAPAMKTLSDHFDEVISLYEISFRQRVQGLMGGPLTNFEKAAIKDFLMDVVVPAEMRKKLDSPLG